MATLTLNVPSIACEVCANTITKAIQIQQPDAQVTVDVVNKIVTVETNASVGEIEQVIAQAGHEVAA
jgi:copper chaperone